MWHFDIWENKRCNSNFYSKTLKLSLPYRLMRFVIEKYSFIQDIWEQRIFESQNTSLLLKSCISFDNHFGEIDWVILRKLSSFIVFFPADQVSSFEYHLQKCSSNYSKEDFVGEISLNMEMDLWYKLRKYEVQFSPWTYEIRLFSKTYPCLLLSGFRRNWSRYSKKAYAISIFPELNFSCLNIMCEKCSYCKEDLKREKIFFDEIWSAIRIVEEVSCSPLHPFEFTHILLLIFIALALEHSNFYSRYFIEDRKSLESSYVFFLKWFRLEIFDVPALHSWCL